MCPAIVSKKLFVDQLPMQMFSSVAFRNKYSYICSYLVNMYGN
jgi:hypothetical protein